MGNCFPFFPVICRLGVSSHWLYVSPILRVILLQVLLVTLLAYSVPWRARTHLPARRQKQNAPEWLGGAGRCTNSPIQFIAPPHREVSCCILLCVFSTEWIIACQCQPLSTVKSILSISWQHYKLHFAIIFFLLTNAADAPWTKRLCTRFLVGDSTRTTQSLTDNFLYSVEAEGVPKEGK